MKTLSSVELCEVTGATYRQLDYWCRLEIIKPTSGEGNPGAGFPRRFDVKIVEPLKTLVQISEAFDYAIRTETLRKIYNNYKKGKLDLGNGIALIWKVK